MYYYYFPFYANNSLVSWFFIISIKRLDRIVLSIVDSKLHSNLYSYHLFSTNVLGCLLGIFTYIIPFNLQKQSHRYNFHPHFIAEKMKAYLSWLIQCCIASKRQSIDWNSYITGHTCDTIEAQVEIFTTWIRMKNTKILEIPIVYFIVTICLL